MLTRKTHSFLWLLALMLWSVPDAAAQAAHAGEEMLFSTKDVAVHADTTGIYTVMDFEIEGNKRTRDRIILRELPFSEGESYPLSELMERCRLAHSRLMNTGLFLDVVVGVARAEFGEARILVSVKERWYFFPVPLADVVGTTYPQWLKNGMPLHHIRYGVRLKHKNISGLNDRLSLNLTNGYQKEVQVAYEGLPLNHGLNWTLNLGFATGRQRDVVYATERHKPQVLHDPRNFLLAYTQASASVSWRPAIRTRHSFGLSWRDERYADTLASLNKVSFHQQSRVQFPELGYHLHFLDLDFAPYPTRGLESEVQLLKKGFSGPVNLWQLSARASWFRPVTSRSFLNLRATGMLKLPFEQPFPMQQFVGHNSMFLQGYEPYTIDGVAGGFVKASYHQRIIDRKFGIRVKRLPQLGNIPVKAYVKVYGNAGYIHHEQPGTNFLNNRLLRSAGIGLDLVLFYDFIFRIEYSVNSIGQKGLYLHDRNRW